MHAKLLQLCQTLCDPMNCSLPGSSVHGILQARKLDWVAISSYRGCSGPRDWTHVFYISCIGRQVLCHHCHLESPCWKRAIAGWLCLIQRSNCQHPLDHWKSREFQKNTYFCFIDYAKAFDSVDHKKLAHSLRDGNTRPPYLSPEKPVCRSRSNS